MKKIKFLSLFFLILVALFLRFYKLDKVPNSLHLDEIANVYTGRFILENKVDLYGNKFPLFYFDKFGDYPPVIPMYIQAIGTYIFGVNDLGSRGMTAILSCFIIIPVFFIVLIIFNNLKTAFFAGLLVAVLPWQIVFARQSAEAVIASFFYFFGIWLLFNFINKKKLNQLFFSLPFFFITFFTYPSFRIITPLTFFPLFIFFINKKNFKNQLERKKLLFYSIFSFLFFSLIAFLIINSYWGKGRGLQVSIFNFVSGVENNNLQLIYREKNPLIARIFNNKIIGYSRKFLEEYFKYFSPSYLFISGGGEITHKVPNTGELYLTILPLILFGLLDFTRKKNRLINKPLFYYSIYLLLISAVPGGLTVVAVPNFHRTFPMSIFYIILACYGFNALTFIKIKKIYLSFFVYPFLFMELIYFMHNFINHVDYIQFIGNNEGAREAFLTIAKNKNNYSKIFTPGTNYLTLYYLYYQKNFSKDLVGKFKQKYYLSKIDNIYFFDDDCFFDQAFKKIKSDDKVLFLLKEQCVSDYLKNPKINLKLINKFKTGYGNYSFWLYEFDGLKNKEFLLHFHNEYKK